jgi:hypothetical protein
MCQQIDMPIGGGQRYRNDLPFELVFSLMPRRAPFGANFDNDIPSLFINRGYIDSVY